MFDVWTAITLERDHQANRWADGTRAGLAKVDDKANHSPMQWVTYITAHATRWFGGGFDSTSSDALIKFRTQMVKVAALAVSAAEWATRRLEERE